MHFQTQRPPQAGRLDYHSQRLPNTPPVALARPTCTARRAVKSQAAPTAAPEKQANTSALAQLQSKQKPDNGAPRSSIEPGLAEEFLDVDSVLQKELSENGKVLIYCPGAPWGVVVGRLVTLYCINDKARLRSASRLRFNGISFFIRSGDRVQGLSDKQLTAACLGLTWS